MASVITIFRQITIMFIYMGIGYFLFKKELITKDGSKSMANLLLYCVLPCVIVQSFLLERTSESTERLLVGIGLSVILLAISILVSAALFRKNPIDNFGVAFSNAGFMGFPLISAIIGSENIFCVVGFVALLNILQWTYGQRLFQKDKQPFDFGGLLKNPIVLSMIAGLVFYFLQIPIPAVLKTPLSMISNMNAPLAMIILGIYLAQCDVLKLFSNSRLYKISIARLFLIPALSLLVCCILPDQYKMVYYAVLIAASAPIGSNVAVYAQKQGMDYIYAVQTVCISTLLSIVSMPIMLVLTEYLLMI